MTNLERAQKLALTVMQHSQRVNYMEMTAWLQHAFDAVAADEREECAKTAFDIAAEEDRCMGACERVAFAIRARGAK